MVKNRELRVVGKEKICSVNKLKDKVQLIDASNLKNADPSSTLFFSETKKLFKHAHSNVSQGKKKTPPDENRTLCR